MIVCKNCDNKITPQCKGDGECKKHGRFSFYMNDLKEPCSKCAEEKQICQICGGNLEEGKK